MKRIFFLCAGFFLASHLFAQQKLTSADLEELKSRMTGSFSTELQAKEDTAFFNISLHMARIWKERKDGFWLYVEQAVATSLSKPYRQRIYHVYQQDDSTIISKVFELNSPLRFAGAWNKTDEFNPLSIDSLIDRKGCAIFLHKNKQGDYEGTTPGKECLSSRSGATYATSEVVIEKEKLVSWDRGWDAGDKQVWGSVKGGYRFIKKKD